MVKHHAPYTQVGTIAVVSPVPMIMSFIPSRYLHRVFNDVVIGTVVILIGVKLVGVGFEYWVRVLALVRSRLMITWSATQGGGSFCAANPQALCISNGDVQLVREVVATCM